MYKGRFKLPAGIFNGRYCIRKSQLSKKEKPRLNVVDTFCSEVVLVFNLGAIVFDILCITAGSSTKFFHSSVPNASHSFLCPVTRNLSLKWNNDEEERRIGERTRLRKQLLFDCSTRYASTKKN